MAPPVETLPPSAGGLTPGVAGGVVPPVAMLPPGVSDPGTAPPPEGCIPGAGDETVASPGPNPACPDLDAGPPLTAGREMGDTTTWAAWADIRRSDLTDRRYGLNIEGEVTTAAFGMDRRFNADVVAGASISFQSGETRSFGGLMQSSTDGFTVGPYVAIRLSKHWAADASLNYTRIETDKSMPIFSGESSMQQLSGALNVSGQFTVKGTFLRPKISLNYSYSDAENYELQGVILGRDIVLHLDGGTSWYGMTEATLEATRIFGAQGPRPFMPYAEIGVRYEFDRPNGGQMMTGRLGSVTPSAWSGSVRGGVRVLMSDAFLIEVGGGYLSLGRNGLDVWEGKFYLSYRF